MTNQRRPRQTTAPSPSQVTTVEAARESAPSTITFRVSPSMLRQLLRLAQGVTIVGAGYDPATNLVVFDLDVPNAPDGAVELVVSYRHTGKPDPIHAQSEWFSPPNGDAA